MIDLFSPLLCFLQAQGSFRAAVYIVFIEVEDFLPTAGQGTFGHMLRQSEPKTKVDDFIRSGSQCEKRLLNSCAGNQDVPACSVECIHMCMCGSEFVGAEKLGEVQRPKLA